MRIASWNINSLRKRQDRLFAWLEATKPDIVCLQETKCPDEQFLALALEAASYTPRITERNRTTALQF